eukprot:c17440_g1_i1 orf=265-1209(-)
MAMAFAAHRATFSAGHGCGERQWVFRKPWPPESRQAYPYSGLTSPSLRFSPLQMMCAQFGKSSRPVAANSNRFFISASTDSKAPANVLLKLPSVRFIIMALTIFVILHGPLCDCAQASEAIKASSLGLKVASFLRRTGWPDEAIVFLIAMLPVLELRGAIPVGYWMNMDPVKISVLSVLGNMVPVPFIVLYMEKLAKFLSNQSSTAKKIMDALFESTRKKAAPIQEFEWLGLMLFVAVPFPGTGAWTGAMVASMLGMPFWEAMSANFFGVVMAGLLVNLLVNLGLKAATMVGIVLFLISTFMWSFLRAMGKSKH